MSAGAQQFYWSDQNPNDSIGGAGCACGERAPEDRCGPYKIFPHTEMVSSISPHNVLCAPCAGGPPVDAELTAGPYAEVTVLDAVELPQLPERDENPESDDWDLPAL
jgi:hypothetical protein